MKKQLLIIALVLIGISIGALALSYKYLRPTRGMTTMGVPSGYVQAEIKDVEFISHGSGVVYLSEKGGSTILPIYISEEQARTIVMLMNEIPSERPFMHDLMGSLLDNSNMRVDYVSVDGLEEGIYYATIALRNGKFIMIDARPSDSIILALRENAPIYINAELLKKEGITTHPPIDILRGGFSV
jgi:bifunctional DNase/RNase